MRFLARRVTTKRLGREIERRSNVLVWAFAFGKVAVLIERPNSRIPERLHERPTIDVADLMPNRQTTTKETDQ